MHKLVAVLAIFLLPTLAACSGGGSSSIGSLPAMPSEPGASSPSTPVGAASSMRVTIALPSAATRSAAFARKGAIRVRPMYESPNATSVTIAVATSTGAAYGQPSTHPLVAGAAGCTTTSCSFQIAAPLGVDTISAKTQATAGGPILAAGYGSETVKANAANSVAFALGGVPASVKIVQTHSFVDGAGAQSSPVVITAYDASGAVIVGAPYASATGVGAPLSVAYSGASNVQLSRNGAVLPTNSGLAISPSDTFSLSFDGTHISGVGATQGAQYVPASAIVVNDSAGGKVATFGVASSPAPIVFSGLTDSQRETITLAADGTSTASFSASQVGLQLSYSQSCDTGSPNYSANGTTTSAPVTSSYNASTNTTSFSVGPYTGSATPCSVTLFSDFGSISGTYSPATIYILSTGTAPVGSPAFTNSVSTVPSALAFASVTAVAQQFIVTPLHTPTYTGPIGISTDACIVPSLTAAVPAAGTGGTNVIIGDATQVDAPSPNAIVSWTPSASTSTANSSVQFELSPIAPGLCLMRSGEPAGTSDANNPNGNQDPFPISVAF